MTESKDNGINIIYIHDYMKIIYIYKEDCLSLSPSLSVLMHSHSFQGTKFHPHRYVSKIKHRWIREDRCLARLKTSENLTTIRTVFKMQS